jgi:hypothetical protein
MFINEFNKNALGIAFKTSKNEGILRNHIYYDGKYWNAYVLGMLKDEFEKQTDKLAELGFTYVKTKQYV